MRSFYTLTTADVGRPWLRIFGRVWLTTDWIGRVLPQDVGKRVYLVGEILQVENYEQRKQRLAREKEG